MPHCSMVLVNVAKVSLLCCCLRLFVPTGSRSVWCLLISDCLCRLVATMNHTERDVALSKALSSLLRHNATRRGVAIRPDGFCVVSDVLHSMGLLILGATVEDVQRVTRNSSKGRFELRNEQGVLLVRATQGHSMAAVQDALLLRQLRVDGADLP